MFYVGALTQQETRDLFAHCCERFLIHRVRQLKLRAHNDHRTDQSDQRGYRSVLSMMCSCSNLTVVRVNAARRIRDPPHEPTLHPPK